jgi:hypothetical protein
LYEQIKPKLVLGENVAQAGEFAVSGNAHAAVIPPMTGHIRQLTRYAIAGWQRKRANAHDG